MEDKWIFAYKYNNRYVPEYFVNLDTLDGLEYQDVESGEYQVWQWPSGKIYNIATYVENNSVDFIKLLRYTDREDEPVAVFDRIDKELVDQAYREMKG